MRRFRVVKPPLLCRLIKHKPKVFEVRQPTKWVKRDGYWTTRVITELDPVAAALNPGTPRMVSRPVPYWQPPVEVGIITEFWMCKRQGCTRGGSRYTEVTREIPDR